MPKKLKDSILTKRAFACVEENDTEGLLECLQNGFNVNTKLSKYKKDGTPKSEETVCSRALEKRNWAMLKEVIEHVGSADPIIFAHFRFDSTVAPRTRFAVMIPLDKDFWEEITKTDFKTSPFHFCLWHVCGPHSKVSDFDAGKIDPAFGVVVIPSEEAKEKIATFFRNCTALEQKILIGEHVSPVKESKALGSTERKF